tara:strand:- start:396 stop:1058 length:663 start_codon:yes stop_codon:yes gene_type:complete
MSSATVSHQELDHILENFPRNPEFKGVGNDRLDLTGLSQWTSIYIPVVPTNLHLSNQDNVTNRFYPKNLKTFIENNLNLGKVKRVDFVDRNIETSSVTVKGAFIHFEYWYDSDESKYVRHILDTKQKYRQMGYQYNDKMCSFYTRDSSGATHPAYLMMKINHKPIEEVDYDVNVHQLKAVINRFEQEKIVSDNTITDLNNTISELTAILEKLSQQISITM